MLKVLLESMGFYVMDQKGLHKVSVVSPLSFTIMQEALSREIRSGNSDKLFYAEDLVLVNESLKSLKGRVGAKLLKVAKRVEIKYCNYENDDCWCN